jgi:hypothetical protein
MSRLTSLLWKGETTDRVQSNGGTDWKAAYEKLYRYAEGLKASYTKSQQIFKTEVEREVDIRVGNLKQQLEKALGDAARKDALYKARTADLQTARAFLKTTDTLSGAEIVHKVQELNTQIHQTASFVADDSKYAEERSAGIDEMNHAVHWCYKWLGSDMSQMLLCNNHSDDPTLVQWAMQAAMLCFCAEVVSSWCSGREPEVEARLVHIYQAMKDHGKG